MIVAGAFLVLPASQSGLPLSLPIALGAIVAAAVVGTLMLGLGGYVGADARVPAMVLLRAPLGRCCSYLPTGLNVRQCLGRSVFQLIIIATGASALSEQLGGLASEPPRVPPRALIGAAPTIATGGALVLDLRNYQPFLYLLGSFFVPLFGVLLGDWLLAGRHYDRDEVFGAPALRPELVAAWLAGFCLYQWLARSGPAGGHGSSRTQTRTHRPGAGPRCPASPRRSASQPSPAAC